MKPQTDRNTSSAADEFIWDVAEHTEVHNYVREPILRLLKAHSASSVLDLGCGNGAFTALLADSGYVALGVDHSLSGIEIARDKYHNLDFRQHDVTTPLADDYIARFDAVIAVEVIEHLLLPRKLMENAIRALKPGGLLIVTTPYHGYLKNLALALAGKFDDHWHPLRDYGHIKFFSKKTLINLFEENNLKEIHVQTVGRIPPLARSMIVSATKPQ